MGANLLPDREKERKSMSTQRILIIDDEEQIRETMRFALEAAGYSVETAVDGPSGLEAFGDGAGWDLVLLDQRMPGLEGLEVLQRVRERDATARVMMITAYASVELAVDAMKAGAEDFLRKPFTPDVLRGAVAAALTHPRGGQGRATGPSAAVHTGREDDRPTPVREGLPLIHFRTLNGFAFWFAALEPGEEETEAFRIRRVFEVRPPSGELQRCAVDLTTTVRERVTAEIGRDLPPADPIWGALCKSALSNFLWQQARMPSEVMAVYELTREQVHLARRMAGLGLRAWG
jgi:DNA-binding response OmpR family regulator